MTAPTQPLVCHCQSGSEPGGVKPLAARLNDAATVHDTGSTVWVTTSTLGVATAACCMPWSLACCSSESDFHSRPNNTHPPSSLKVCLVLTAEVQLPHVNDRLCGIADLHMKVGERQVLAELRSTVTSRMFIARCLAYVRSCPELRRRDRFYIRKIARAGVDLAPVKRTVS